ncbi:MAG: hypothetical protein HDS43_04420 [Bacteroides sp.]|nr:hypothetical protein [Bacteroides sp.]
MIDDELMKKFDSIEDLPVSEETKLMNITLVIILTTMIWNLILEAWAI